MVVFCFCPCYFFVQAEDGIRDLVRSRGLGDVYKRQRRVWNAGVVVDRVAGRDFGSAVFGRLQL